MSIWTKKSIKELLTGEEHLNQDRTLKRTLGAYDLIMFGIGATIGAGLFSISGIAAAQHAGPAVLISFLIAAMGCGFAGLCYSELAGMIPIAGSAYTYAYASMGEIFAWMIGWDLILEYAVGAATVAVSWSAYLSSFLRDVGIDLPWQLTTSPWHTNTLSDGTTIHGLLNLPAMAIIVATSLVLMVGIRYSAAFNAYAVIIKLAVIFLFVSLGMAYIDTNNYVPFIPPNQGKFGAFGWSGILRASGLIFFAYIGFDSLSTAAQEVKNPQKNVPIGILGSLAVCTLLYICFSLVMLGMVPYTALNVEAPVAVAIDKTPYMWLKSLIKLAVLAGFSSVILVSLLGQSRIFYAMARDGLLPSFFANIHPAWRTPWLSNLILMIIVALFSGLIPFETLGNLTSIGTLFAFAVVCLAVLILRRRHPEYPRAFRVPGGSLIPILGCATCLMMMLSLDVHTWIRLLVWMALGLIIYLCHAYRSSSKTQKS